VGVIDDPVFGPVVTFGAGGTAVEILHDRAVALPPLNEHIARSMIRQTQVSRMLGEFRGLSPINLDALVQVLLRVSEMVCELPQIKEMDINPLTVDEEGAFVLDARIVVAYQAPGQNPYDHMAIHPYPSHLVSHWQLPDGTDITLRPIRPEDAEIERAFVRGLSPEAKYFRFMESIHELSQEMLVRFTQLDYQRELAFIATTKRDGQEIELGVARYFTNPDGESGEFALVVADAWQHKGIGTRLMSCLIEAAREKGFRSLQGEVLANNVKMLHLMTKLGFTSRLSADEPGVMILTKPL
jgi:acetyltransferase